MFQKKEKEERFAVKSKEAFQGWDLAVLVDKQQTGVRLPFLCGPERFPTSSHC